MSTILAETTATSVPVKCVVNKNGPVTGLSIVCSVYDTINDTWLDFDDDTFQTTPVTQTKALVYKASGLYRTTVNTSNASATAKNLTVLYDITAGSTDGVGEDEIILGDQWHGIAGQAELDIVDTTADSILTDTGTIDTTTTNILTDTGTDIPATLATLSTATALTTVNGLCNSILSDTDAIDTVTAATLDVAISTRSTLVVTDILSDSIPFRGKYAETSLNRADVNGLVIPTVTTVIPVSGWDAAGVADQYNGYFIKLVNATNGTETRKIIAHAAGSLTVDAAFELSYNTGDDAYILGPILAAPGDAMDLIANAVDAAALATDAVTEIRNSILSDGTAFDGADIAAILTDTTTDIPAILADMKGAGFLTSTDSLEAIRDRGDAEWVTGAGASAPATASAVWDALAASYDNPNSMGELLNGAGGAFTPAQVADAVWAEAIADHLGAGQAAQYVTDILTDTAAIGPDVTDILTDTAAMQPVVAANLDAVVSTRAVPGDSMVVSSIVANAVNAAALAADAVAEITASVAGQVTTDHGSGGYATAAGFAIAGDAMSLTAQQEADLVDAVWDESNAAHVQAGTTGESLDIAAQAGAGTSPAIIADAVWDELRAGHTDAGSFGFYLDEAVSNAGDPSAVAAAVWGEAQAGYSSPGTFGYYVDGQITDAGDPAAIADAVWDEVQTGHTTAGTFGLYLDSEVSLAGGGSMTEATIADAVWDEIAAQHTDGGSFGENLSAAVASRSVAGDAMTLTAGADGSIADAVWDEDGSLHLIAGSSGYLQDQAATGGAGVTPLQIQQAVWDAEQSVYQALGTMGKAVSDSQDVPAELQASIDRYFQIVRQYGPIAAQQPIATRDEVHVDDVGIILTVPVILDGAYSDLADATSIDFDFISPSGAASQKAGIGVTTPSGSYTTWTTDDTVFDAVGRWRVQVTVTWPDVSTKSSNVYAIDIQPPMPAL